MMDTKKLTRYIMAVKDDGVTIIPRPWSAGPWVKLSDVEKENSKPETCPLCLGDGKWKNNITFTTQECPCCDGKGSL